MVENFRRLSARQRLPRHPADNAELVEVIEPLVFIDHETKNPFDMENVMLGGGKKTMGIIPVSAIYKPSDLEGIFVLILPAFCPITFYSFGSV